jgi:hydrogenase maturation protein HypF
MEIRGLVQGVGFRPFVFTLARELNLGGLVRNDSSGVTLEIEGARSQVQEFSRRLMSHLPPLARIDSVEVHPLKACGEREFRIVPSEPTAHASTPISPDVATCGECLREMGNRDDRRYRYPFINCTNCGPRYTIVRDIPYDRPQTTMREFTMCAHCAREYHDPANRRYHAQPNACPVCGPRVWFVGGAQVGDPRAFASPGATTGESAIDAFHRCIAEEGVVATKGIGGFHLACSAESAQAIGRLRARKGRVDKPLAVMVADLESARRLAHVNDEEAEFLCSRARPIVLLRRRPGLGLADLVAPGNALIGIMLAYSPLHALLVQRGPLVMTSGNVSEEPIARTNQQAHERLGSMADAFLLHDREIHVVCDDSVIRVLRGAELPIRRSRGYAPQPIRWAMPVPPLLAVGGELKATFCLTRDQYAYMSPHIGDMGNLETLDAFRRAVDHFLTLFRIEPAAVACDMHPGYLSTQWAQSYAAEHALPVIEVQHHHAHLASVLAEHDLPPDQAVIGVCFDGTGYGSDGAIWGGEVLLGSCGDFRRWAHLKYVALPGGDASIKHPYRAALAHLWAAGLPWDERLPCVGRCPPRERTSLQRQLERNLHCVATSSMGRLFDAVAALIGVRQSVSYEAQAAIELETLAGDDVLTQAYPVFVSADDPREVEPGPMLAAICQEVAAGVSPASISRRFHATIVQLVGDLCLGVRNEAGLERVALSGGVFQNQLLLRMTLDHLEGLGFEVLIHRQVPPNDGGLALGQAAVAAARWTGR